VREILAFERHLEDIFIFCQISPDMWVLIILPLFSRRVCGKPRRRSWQLMLAPNTEISLAANGQYIQLFHVLLDRHSRELISRMACARPLEQSNESRSSIRRYIFLPSIISRQWICGSGILDAVAEMKEAGISNEKGAMQSGQNNVRSIGRNARISARAGGFNWAWQGYNGDP